LSQAVVNEQQATFQGAERSGNFSVAIIGGGVGGIAAAIYLRRAGIRDITIYERSSGPGGTWYDNRYPGAACDVQSHLYSFSFAIKRDWTRVHATQPEILAYVEEVVDRFGLRPLFRFGTKVSELRWDDGAKLWDLTTQSGRVSRYNVVISSVGLLNVPNVCTIPGLEEFQGPKFHTALWENHDLAGKRVAVIGAGSSAAQVVPAIAPSVDQLLVFQREPGWVIPNPAGKEDLEPEEIEGLRRSPLRVRWQRYKYYWQREIAAAVITPGSGPNRRRADICLDWLRKNVHDPQVREALTPSYPFNCKRPTRDPEFLQAFNRENVTLIPHEVTGFTRTGIVSADGVERPIDVAVLAIGFQAANFLASLKIYGRNGAELHDEWERSGGPEAFLGISVAGFPNFFMQYGPNTNSSTGSIIFNLECQARYIARCVRNLARRSPSAMEVKRPVQERYNAWLHKKMPKTAWLAGCNNYYRTEHGKQVTNWPHTAVLYWFLMRALPFTNRWLYRYSRAERHAAPRVSQADRRL
jgi:cation diffusion facilitator CzcD-associated flavoprotein CzcO